MNDDLYRVEKYTDQQLYDILDINNPTDGELEAKILQLIRKYKNLQNDSGDKLALFFENIYNHFFVAETEPMQEGGTTPRTDFIDVSNNLAVAANPQNIASVKTFEYSKDNLQINPLIKETISRVISVDSSYRDRKTYPYSTDFTFDLSEPLKDVVSLKLYSVQIPYTWYTVNKSYGSNFFFISSIHSDKSYKIQIDPGEYTKSTLIGAINTAFTDISNGEASDINFNGETFVEEIGAQTKAKINLNIQNTFNDTYYSLGFPAIISSYLGFTNTTYSLNSIVSAKQDLSGIQNEVQENYVIDASNNYFTVIQYIPNDSKDEYSGQKQILKEIKVYISVDLPSDGLNQSRSEIYTLVNEAIQKEPLFDNSYTKLEELKDISNNTYFRFTVVLDRKKVKYVPNSKIALIFPDEGLKNHNGQSFSIWNNNINAAYNCFKFENSYNILSKLKAETQYQVSDVTLDLSQNITFKCNTPGYEGVNDFSFNITPFGTYNLPQFLTNINTTINNYSNANDSIFNTNTTNISFDSENKVNFNIDMTKTFGNANYRIIIDASSVLQSDKNQTNYTSTFDTSGNAGNVISGRIENITAGYSTTRTHLLRIVPSGTGGNKNAAPIDIELQPKNGARTYASISDFVEYLNLSILNKTVSVGNIGDVQKPFRGPPTLNSPPPFTYKEPSNIDTIIDISLNLHCIYQLFESHYSVYFNAYDISFSNSPWGILQIDPSYNLFNKKNDAGTYSIIIGNEKTNSNRIDITSQNNILVLNTTNPVAPQDTISLTLKPDIYTIDTLYKEINEVFRITPKTYGSFITSTNAYSEIWLNINNVYTTADYKLVFYNPFSFMSCGFNATIQKTTWDTTVGWMLGFRDYTEYGFTSENIVRDLNDSTKTYYLKSTSGGYTYSSTSYPSPNQTPLSVSITLTGDTSISVNLFNYFLISLDDYIQNHLNDGLVTITKSQTALETLNYSYSSRYKCDPGTNTVITAPLNIPGTNKTNAQLYSINQSILSNKSSYTNYSPGPYIKDLFGLVPIKLPAKTGETYTEFGGTLQNQNRVYFGPVNIRKLTIQLLSDRGNLVDLNGADWTFSFICEQLYRS